MRTKRTLLLVLFGLAVAGCSSDGQTSKTDEATIKNNFTRSLTPEEIAKMGGSKEKTRAPNDKL